ncbi:FecR family protein [Pseudomonas sp. 681]|uniref:FecR family protein n=1 Tax=Pseudomonas fungipugnans TaxID=3024217 RepID=A0ABT6QI37_9PSED|nr:FecR family protein [Pseudomonas sp. 681]MDI2589934.1 FecR family protein [Pseudomonas sp. 681]
MTEHTLSEAEYDAITDAAAHWCMRLHASDCTGEERQAFQQWHDAHPLHAFEYEAMLEIWDVAGDLPHPQSPAPAPPPSVGTPGKYPRSWRTLGVVAATCALALPLAAYTGWNLGWVPNAYQHFEATDNLRQVTLNDGTLVELNLGSELTYTHYRDERRVTLKKGEAFFTVRHDITQPFTVKAAEGRIRVTGTRFNVWMYEDKVRVNLIEGSVQVTSQGDLTHNVSYLRPGMQASYRQGDFAPQVSQTSANDSALAWRTGKLVLDDLPLSDALPLINRYLSAPVMLADSNTAAIRIGGVYDTRQVKNLVTSLPRVLPVYLTRNQDGNPVINSMPLQPPKS